MMRPITYNGPASRARYWRKLYNQAGPATQRAGLTWYATARAWIAAEARAYVLEPAAVAGLVAVLSPRVNWNDNQAEASAILEAYTLGLEPGPLSAFPANQGKAYAILAAALEGRPWLHYVRGPKVSRFHAALCGRPAVVIDAHMMRAAGLPERMAERPRVYATLSAAITRAAGLEAIRPEGLQAVVWLATREGRNV